MLTLRKYSGSASETGTDGVMSLEVWATQGEYKTIDGWLERNGVNFNHDCQVTKIESQSGELFRKYTFFRLSKVAIAFRLSFHRNANSCQHSMLWNPFCEYLIERTKIITMPLGFRESKRDELKAAVVRLDEWMTESGINLINLYDFEKLSSIPLLDKLSPTRQAFIYFTNIKNFPKIMPAVMFFCADDAALYKLAWL